MEEKFAVDDWWANKSNFMVRLSDTNHKMADKVNLDAMNQEVFVYEKLVEKATIDHYGWRRWGVNEWDGGYSKTGAISKEYDNILSTGLPSVRIYPYYTDLWRDKKFYTDFVQICTDFSPFCTDLVEFLAIFQRFLPTLHNFWIGILHNTSTVYLMHNYFW